MTTTTIGAGSDVLALGITEDAYQGDAQFTVGVDGQQIDGVLTATSPHGGTLSDTVNVLGNWAPGTHTVTVNFLNDAWDGSPATDRNLYIDGVTYDGAFIPRVAQELAVNGPVSFGITSGAPAPSPSTTTTIGTGSDTLVLKVSEDAYKGDAQFAVILDGQPVGGVLTASSLHSSGASDTVNVLANLIPGPHTVTVNFLNDLYSGSPATDRNLYIDGATYNGVAVSGASQELAVNGPVSISITDPKNTVTWSSGTTEASQLSPVLTPGDALIVKTGATVMAEGSQLAGVSVDLAGQGNSGPAPNGSANLTLTGAAVGSLTIVDPDLSDGSSARFGHLDIYGQSAVTGGITIGGSKPFAPGFFDAYVHGSDGVLALHGVFLGGLSTLTIKGDAGSAVENDGNIGIQGGANTGFVAILNDLKGTGTITGGADYASDTASVRLGGSVGAGQTINLSQTNLQLDKPMDFQGTLAGFNIGRASGVTLENETVTSTAYAQSAPSVGTLSVFTQDPTTGAAGATLAFHVAGDFASKTFAFTNDAAAHSTFLTLAA